MFWTATSHLAPTLQVSYPVTNERGLPVRLDQNERDGVRQIHALAEDRESVYFEAVVFGRHLDHERLIGRMVEAFGAPPEREEPWHTAVQPGVIGAFATSDFRVGWTEAGREMTRTMRFFDASTSTVRLVYDHRSPTNLTILERLAIDR